MLNSGTKAAIAAIVIVIPLSSYALWSSEQNSAIGLITLERHKVLATFNPLYKFTKIVAGDKIDVSIIIPSGLEPHDWEPTIQDIQRLKNADMIIINGAGLEPWITKFVSANPNLMVVDTSSGIQLLDRKSGFGNLGEKDPHIWLDPVLAKVQIQNIANALIKLDPENTNYYQHNADEYKTKLDSLDNEIKAELSNCKKKDFLAVHDAFSYFSREYGLHQNTILVGLNPESEPTATTLEQITQKAKDLGLNVVFTEEAVNPQISKVIADEIHGKVLVLSPLEVGNTADDYVDKMEQNLSNLKEALCS